MLLTRRSGARLEDRHGRHRGHGRRSSSSSRSRATGCAGWCRARRCSARSPASRSCSSRSCPSLKVFARSARRRRLARPRPGRAGRARAAARRHARRLRRGAGGQRRSSGAAGASGAGTAPHRGARRHARAWRFRGRRSRGCPRSTQVLPYLPLAVPFALATVVGGIDNTESAHRGGRRVPHAGHPADGGAGDHASAGLLRRRDPEHAVHRPSRLQGHGRAGGLHAGHRPRDRRAARPSASSSVLVSVLPGGRRRADPDLHRASRSPRRRSSPRRRATPPPSPLSFIPAVAALVLIEVNGLLGGGGQERGRPRGRGHGDLRSTSSSLGNGFVADRAPLGLGAGRDHRPAGSGARRRSSAICGARHPLRPRSTRRCRAGPCSGRGPSRPAFRIQLAAGYGVAGAPAPAARAGAHRGPGKPLTPARTRW